jgi:hypothetical protein
VESPEVGAFLADASRRLTSPSSPKLLYMHTVVEARTFFASQLEKLSALCQLKLNTGSIVCA